MIRWLTAVFAIPANADRLDRMEENMATEQEELNALTADLKTGFGEILGKIDELQAANKRVDFSELREIVQKINDVVPGTPTTPPGTDETAPPVDGGETTAPPVVTDPPATDVPVVEAPVTVVPATEGTDVDETEASTEV